ncbi:hypothetical protein RhiirA5_495125 [Rhizophagus irregularis]|uniref:Uncharacterized protein n=1 Tax=Rhizophagus irregularis TaxID=588596 RepID=A0A2N0Q6M6_9GLOM|nr:hypothetical protein RhiirA5_495125 [Rhizophagus irregularis]CAB5192798.1 unnamed protein product [Rhizophagus irregularis]
MVFAENKQSTEPYSFIFLKKLCSFSFIIILIYYTYDQFYQFSNSISKPNLIFRKQHVREILNTAKNINITIEICGTDNCTYTYNGNNTDWKKCVAANEVPFEVLSDNVSVPDCFRYSFDYQERINIEVPPITAVHLDGLEIDQYYYAISSSPLFFINNTTTTIYYSPTIIKQISDKYVYGLAGGKSKEYVDFNVHTDMTPLITPNVTTFVLRPISMNIYYQEETYYDLGSIISSIGGFFSSLSGIFVFLFGASKLAPWGFLQIYVFNCLCIRYQRKLAKKLKSKYEPIPFISGRTKNFTLEERIQSMENLLEEYYLDTNFLNLLIEENNVDDKV